jgi:hypothetical protein
MSRDYIDLKIDVERNLNGEVVAKRLRKEQTGGIPWMVITDEHGKELINADGPEGNIGCPVAEAETAWFMTMIRRTARRLTDAEIATIEAELIDNAKLLGR